MVRLSKTVLGSFFGLALVAAALPMACTGSAANVASARAVAAPSVAHGGVGPGSSPRPPGTPAPIIGEYNATWDPAAGDVKVEARFAAGAGAIFTVDRGAEVFAKEVEMSADRDGAAWSLAVRRGRELQVSACASSPCRIRYRYELRAAARRLDDLDTASEEGDVIEAPPSTWLLAPAAARDLRLRFRVTCPEGSRFVTGVFHSTEAAGAYDITLDDLWTSPYTAFGPLRVRAIPVKGATIELAMAPGKVAATDDDLATWTEASARAVSAYFGRFPMPSALVLLVVSRGRWVGSGRTLSGGGGTVFVRIGERAPPKAYRDDWVLVHEMIHLTFPSVPSEQNWAEEGIATYAEPFARVRAGMLSEEDAWVGLAEGLPNGLPGPNDRGLDHTPTWGRVYWGGALFWFLADIEIRKRTSNRLGLEHALRGIMDAGGSNATRWSLEDVLTAGDRATGVPVLTELHVAMGSSPHPVDLDAIMKSLGVEVTRGRAQLDDKAPFAAIRRAMARGGNAATLAPP